jgi:hypothetical protein
MGYLADNAGVCAPNIVSGKFGKPSTELGSTGIDTSRLETVMLDLHYYRVIVL